MKSRHIMILAVAAAVLGGGNALAQNTNDYNNSSVVHRAGKWYRSDYREAHSRGQGSDNFDNGMGTEADGMKPNPIHPQEKLIQKTHEYREDVYINPGYERTLLIPAINGNSTEYFNYQRWYNFREDGALDLNYISFPENSGNAYVMKDGVYCGRFLKSDVGQNSSLRSVTVKVPDDFNTPYYLACDLSDYNDVSKPENNGATFYEPTLGLRAIYTIRPASEIKNKINKTDYYEKHDIHFPAHRISTKTPEQVALDMFASNYFVDGENGDCGALTVKFDYGNSGIDESYLSLPSETVKGDVRKISFDQKKDIPDGTVVYINVTKNDGYMIAQFKLTFDANTEGLTLDNINTIKNDKTNPLYFRTNEYLEENFGKPLTSLDFDFDATDKPNKLSGQPNIDYYPYPLSWTTSSYGFFAADGFVHMNDGQITQWGQYCITTGGYNLTKSHLLPGSKYHVYIDANQFPGTICELPFDTKLCPSSKLYFTAWISSLNNRATGGETVEDGSVLFILKGIDDDESEHVIYTQASGQIEDTGNKPWYQVYFEFNSAGQPYDRYVLEVFNNCASTAGGDFCIDDIRIYISPMEVDANTIKPLCTSDSEAEVQVNINYERLLDRLGLKEVKSQGDETISKGYYTFVNKTAYDRLITSGTDYHEAFEKAVVHGNGVYKGSTSNYFGSMGFSTFFESTSPGVTVDGTGSGEGRRISFLASVAANNSSQGFVTLVVGDEYYIAFTNTDISNVQGDKDESLAYKLAEYFDMDDPDCGIRGTFRVEGSLVINVDGEVSTDAATVCKGQQPLIDVQMKDHQGHIVEDAVFDWYFGSIQDFNAHKTEPIAEDEGESHGLADALARFRAWYPEVTSVTDTIVPRENPDDKERTLYKEDIDLIEQLSTDYNTGGLNAKLTLSASKNLAIRLMQETTYVVLVPIGEEPTPAEGETALSICWEPTEMRLYAQDGAPLLDVGRKDVDYRKVGDYAVKVRLGKLQYDNMNNLTVPVRNPRLDNGKSATVKSLANNKNLYLTWTDDPRYAEELEQGGYAFVVGQLAEEFTIAPNTPTNASNVVISFNKQSTEFTPREGYHYSVAFEFTTDDIGDDVPECNGQLVIPLVIVPDYEVWTGGPGDNWNDDSKWRRAEPDEIKKAADSGYMTNADNGTSAGYVPLSATRVVIPTDNGIKLYTAGQLADAGGILDLYGCKGDLTDPTANIEYDLAVAYQQNAAGTDGRYIAGLYYTNRCYRIHFNARGQMLNSHLLTYDRAWTNVEVPTGRWTTVATPLQGVFTGDWYTKTTGEETAEYFTDLKFGSGNNRLQPYVLQRSWNEHAVINEGGDGVDDGSHVESAHTSNVTWSSTYNDIDIQTKPGEGFSVLVGKGSATQDGGTVEFRLPKEDTKFEGFDATFTRRQVNTGLLFSDNLKQAEKDTVKVSPSHDGRYVLIGNPFTSSLDMDEFFDENKGFDKVYWTATDSDPYTGVEGGDGNWLTSGGTSAAVVPPYTAFYVRVGQTVPSSTPLDIVFSRNMAVMPADDGTGTQALQGMTLLAAGAKGNSTALLRYDAAADNGYAKSEDVQLMRESAGTAAPLVYTVAGDMAANINQVKDLQQIPLGLFAADGDVTTLTFTGTDALLEPSLYDAELNTDTPITEGMTLSVNGSSHGRYFIRARGAGEGTSGISEVVGDADGDVTVYSVAERQVVVSSSAGLRAVRVYAVGGQLLKSESVADGRTAVTLDGVDSGVAIVRVTTAAGTTVKKITVK